MLIDHELIVYDDKFIYAERAFMANSAAQWGMGKISRNEFSERQIDNFGKILSTIVEKMGGGPRVKDGLLMGNSPTDKPLKRIKTGV